MASRQHTSFHALYWHLGPYGRQDIHLHPCIDHQGCDAQLVGLGEKCDPSAEHFQKKLSIAVNHWSDKSMEGKPLGEPTHKAQLADDTNPRQNGSHPYTVDAYLVGAEPYPCTICGKGRDAHA
jgi:hypothetical protein